MKSHPIFQIKTKEIKIAQGHTFKTKKILLIKSIIHSYIFLMLSVCFPVHCMQNIEAHYISFFFLYVNSLHLHYKCMCRKIKHSYFYANLILVSITSSVGTKCKRRTNENFFLTIYTLIH